MNLEAIGATPSVYRAFEPYAAQSLTLARVASTHRDRYHLLTAAGPTEGEASGALWYRTPDAAGMPVTGDWVAARVIDAESAYVEAVLPRATFFSRRAAGRREDRQPIAANIDVVFLVCGLDDDFNLRRLERYLTLAMESRAAPVVILNKADLASDLPARISETRVVARDAPIVLASTVLPGGLDALRAHLAPGRTIALLGSSGVGKSSIVNALCGEEILRTAEVLDYASKGRHTTTHRELIPLSGAGALIDTPGMRELQLWAAGESVNAVFDEITTLAEQCRYRDCKHRVPAGCAVHQAIADGTLDPARLLSYQKLQSEVRRHEEQMDPVAAQASKRKLKAMFRAYRKQYKNDR